MGLRGELVGEAIRQPQHRPSDGVREDEPVRELLDRPGGDRHDGPAAAGRQRRVSGPNRPHDAHDEQVVGVVPLAVVGVGDVRPDRAHVAVAGRTEALLGAVESVPFSFERSPGRRS